jgi:hypothetical protein
MSNPKKNLYFSSVVFILHVVVLHTGTLVFGSGLPTPIRPLQLSSTIEKANVTHRTNLLRRWYTLDPGLAGVPGAPELWPDSTVPYCFRNTNSQTQLAKIVKEAWGLWQAA